MNDDIEDQIRLMIAKANSEASAKDVAGKHIGRWGLAYITVIVIIGVGASLYLDEAKIAAVIGLVSAALTALISMLTGISEAEPTPVEATELQIIKLLISKLDNDSMKVDVSEGKVVVNRGSDTTYVDREIGKENNNG